MTIGPLASGVNSINLIVLFIWNFLGSLGLPAGPAAIISAAAISNSTWEITLVLLTTIVSSILGDIAAYELARKFSAVLLIRLRKFKFFRNSESKSSALFKKSEFFIIFFTRFIFIGLCSPVSYISGFGKVGRKKFVAAVVSGEIIYGVGYTLMGLAFKETWNDLASVIGDAVVAAALILIVAFLLTIAVIKRRNRP